MKKTGFAFLLAALMPLLAMADEGMWLMNTFGKVIYPQMKKTGLKLKAEEIYNENGPSLAGAVIAVDGGMGTGSMISDQGLMITNHHVAYGDIQALSTPEKNYLEDGFWALDRKDEIPIKEKTVTFLRKVVDVTADCKAEYEKAKAAGNVGIFTMRRIFGNIEEKYKKEENSPYELACASFFKGELYLLFYYEVFTDVRLVGAPPEKIGAFGGETDNWGWPQHKCDFALYRVYGDKDGKPAKYSPDNVPVKPVKYLKISTSGVKDGDYAMVIGFPGRTNRYKSSFAVEEKRTVTNPIVIKSRRDMLDVMLKHMEANADTRLMYADRYFSISNYADYAKWENICLRRYDVAGIRAQEEVKLQKWIDASPERQKQYGTLLADLKTGYAARVEAMRNKTYYQETWIRSSNLVTLANRLSSVASNMGRKNIEKVKYGDEILNSAFSNAERDYSQMDFATERECFIKLVTDFIANVPQSMWGEPMVEMFKKFNGDAHAMLAYAADNSMVRSLEDTKKFFAEDRTAEEIAADPMVALTSSVYVMTFNGAITALDKKLGYDTDSRETRYAKAIYELRESEGIAQYPDANSTMRITYGTVGPLSAADAVHYDSRSTIRGYMEKYDPNNFEFRVDDKLKSLIKAKDWGRWGADGTLYVNFLSNDDITGGNSGSPVLNAKGDIIGLAFDGNRESMAGDTYYHPNYFKTVNGDIRFVMWIMDKYAGANSLISEMTLVK